MTKKFIRANLKKFFLAVNTKFIKEDNVGSYYQSEELTEEEVARFCADFYLMDLAKVVTLEIAPIFNYRGLRINLRASHIFFELLEDSFGDGMLRKKWGKKFKKLN